MLESIIESLEEKIKTTLKSSNIKSIFAILSSIDEPTLTIGVGGSKVVSLFLGKVLEKRNGIITKDIDVEEFFLSNRDLYKNVLVISHSGKNHGIKSVLKTDNFKKYLLTTRKSQINNEILLRYKNVDRIKSFVSIEDLFIPLGIILSYYLNTQDLPEIFFKEEDFDFKLRETIDIIYDYESQSAAKFLEVSLIEAGIAHVTMHSKYSLCHGRSNIISSTKSLVIYFSTRESDIDKTLKGNLAQITDDIVFLDSLEKDKIVDDFILTWKVLNLLNYINEEFGCEFINVKYNKIVPKLYHFKGDFK